MHSRGSGEVDVMDTKENAGEKSCPYVESCYARFTVLMGNSGLSAPQLQRLRAWVLLATAIFAAMITMYMFVIYYPFKTVVFTGSPPIQVVNPGKKVPLGGVVNMRIPYVKYIDNPSTIVRTLVREHPDHQIEVLDSSTVVSNRKRGSGVTESTFVVINNPYFVGSNCRILYSINYTLFGVRPIMVQYMSERFEIVKNQSDCPPQGQGYLPVPEQRR